ncbi:MAG: hypothetical protein Q9208_001390 [Pyrenodesmia sp. 3 TL-2023]
MNQADDDGADPNQTDDEGQTALHQAAWRGHTHLVQFLLDSGADLTLRDKTGQTALHHAASNGPTATVELLLDNGADPRAEDNNGRKPHSLAEENFHPCAKILRDRETARYGDEVSPGHTNIPKPPGPGSRLDSGVIDFLAVDQGIASIEPYGQASSSTPSKVTIRSNGKTDTYFMKTGPDGDMFAGEYESLAAIHAVVPSLCPRPLAHGKLADSDDYFLLTDFIDTKGSAGGESSGFSLAQKLAQLHSAPPPVPEGFSTPVFGFYVSTSVGRTLQQNIWNRSWPRFFAENRLRAVWNIVETSHGIDSELSTLLDRVLAEVVPRWLGDGHLGGEDWQTKAALKT